MLKTDKCQWPIVISRIMLILIRIRVEVMVTLIIIVTYVRDDDGVDDDNSEG